MQDRGEIECLGLVARGEELLRPFPVEGPDVGPEGIGGGGAPGHFSRLGVHMLGSVFDQGK